MTSGRAGRFYDHSGTPIFGLTLLTELRDRADDWYRSRLAVEGFSSQIPGRNRDCSPEFGPPGPKTNSCQVSFRDYFSGLLFHFRMAKLELTRKLTRFLPGFSQTAFSNPKSWQDSCQEDSCQDSCQDFCTTKSLHSVRFPEAVGRFVGSDVSRCPVGILNGIIIDN